MITSSTDKAAIVRFARAGFGLLSTTHRASIVEAIAWHRASEREEDHAQDESLCLETEGHVPEPCDWECLVIAIARPITSDEALEFVAHYQGASIMALWALHEDLDPDQHTPVCEAYRTAPGEHQGSERAEAGAPW